MKKLIVTFILLVMIMTSGCSTMQHIHAGDEITTPDAIFDAVDAIDMLLIFGP